MPKWAVLATLCTALTLAAVALLRTWPAINVVETGRTPEYPDLQPRRYPMSADRVFEGGLNAVGALPRWRVVSSRPREGEIRAEVTTRLLRFVDDVVIRVEAREGDAVVNVRSASRVGRGDFGQNARNVRAFFEALDRRLDATTERKEPER